MKTKIAAVVFLAVIVLGFVGIILFMNNTFTKDSKESANIALTRIAKTTLTPASPNQVRTLAPFTDVYQLGNIEALKAALSKKYAVVGGDFRVSTGITKPGVGVYCTQAYIPKPGTENLPKYEQVMVLIPGTRYCVATILFVDIWGGVPEKDLEQNIVITPVDQSIKDEKSRTIIHTQKAAIVITARMGILTDGILPGNMVKKTLDDPESAVRSLIEYPRQILGMDAEIFRKGIDKADSLSFEMAQWDALAPNESGDRSTKNLYQLYHVVVDHFNQPSGDPKNPWPYDNLLFMAQTEAKAAGFSGVENLKVIITLPNNNFYYLKDLDTNPTLVIPSDIDARFKDNLYGTQWIPEKEVNTK